MDIQRIREFRSADPFKPFRMVMDDGRKLLVDQPYYLAIAPSGDFLMWSDLRGSFERVSPAKVREVVSVRGANGSSSSHRSARRRRS
jgi:hypothetical protein